MNNILSSIFVIVPYMEAMAVLERCGIPRESIATEKTELYEQLAQVNREIRAMRKN